MRNQIDISEIEAVYSGKNGRCCCGCSGKHTYASAYQKAAGKRRGYEVDNDEVNDRTVKLIVGKINRASDDERQDSDEHRKYYAAVIGERLYIAYAAEQPKRSLITYANNGGGECAATFVANDGKHRVTVRKLGTPFLVSISRCQIILNPDNR